MKILALILLNIFSHFYLDADLSRSEGKASFYSDKMHGRRTASGQKYNKTHFTAAHATLPFNTQVLVTNLKNNKTVVVTINDRLSQRNAKILDVSKAAAKALGMIGDGIATVKIEQIGENKSGGDFDSPESNNSTADH